MTIPQEVSQDFTTQLQNDLNDATVVMLPKAWFIDKAVLIHAFNLAPNSLDGFSGIRIYPGAVNVSEVDATNKTITLITVAVDDANNDMVGNVEHSISDGAKRYDMANVIPPYNVNNVTDLISQAQVFQLNK